MDDSLIKKLIGFVIVLVLILAAVFAVVYGVKKYKEQKDVQSYFGRDVPIKNTY